MRNFEFHSKSNYVSNKDLKVYCELEGVSPIDVNKTKNKTPSTKRKNLIIRGLTAIFQSLMATGSTPSINK